MTGLNDNLKKTIDELDLDRRVEELTKFAQKAVADLKSQAGTLARDNRGKVDEWVEKATAAVDERTNGKYHDKVAKFSTALGNAVDKVAAPAEGSSDPSADSSAQPFPTHPYGDSPTHLQDGLAASDAEQTGWPQADSEPAPDVPVEHQPSSDADAPWYEKPTDH